MHGDVSGRRAFVESPWWKAIVLEIRHAESSPVVTWPVAVPMMAS